MVARLHRFRDIITSIASWLAACSPHHIGPYSLISALPQLKLWATDVSPLLAKFLDADGAYIGHSVVTFRVRTREIYCGHASVCLSVRGRMPTLLHGPGCNLAEW